MIDPEKADLVFYKYPVESFTAGAGIEGIIEDYHEQIVQSTPLAISSSEKALQARKRLNLALLSLPEHRKKYSDFSKKYLQASKVANTFQLHSSLAAADETKNLMDLGFTVDDINLGIQYAHDSLGLNFRSSDDFDRFSKSAIKDLSEVLKEMVIKNFLRHALFEEFFTNDDEMSYLNFQIKDKQVTYTDRDNMVPVPLSEYDSFIEMLSRNFGIDTYRLNHQLLGKEAFNFRALAKEIQESYESYLMDQ